MLPEWLCGEVEKHSGGIGNGREEGRGWVMFEEKPLRLGMITPRERPGSQSTSPRAGE